MPRIFVLSGSDLGNVHSFEGSVRLGRTRECDVVIQDRSISRVHAKLAPEGDKWVLMDLDSSNGIHLGSLRAKRFELSDGDVFRLGKIEMRFRVGGAAIGTPDLEESVSDAPQGSADPPRAEPSTAPSPVEVGDSEPQEDDLFLEEDIDLGEAAHEPGVSNQPSAPPPPATSTPELSLGTGGAPPRPRQSDEDRSALRAAAQRRTAEVTDRREREILQFSTHRSESSAMTSDLSQHPVWVRALVFLLVLGVSAVVFWFAFRGTSSLRGAPEIELDPGIWLEDEY